MVNFGSVSFMIFYKDLKFYMKNIAVKHGLMYGGVSILLFFIFYFVQPKGLFAPTSIYNIVGYILPFVFTYLAAKAARDQNGGFIPFGEAFVPAFLTFIIGGALYHLVMQAMVYYFDPSLMELNLEVSKEISKNTAGMFGDSGGEVDILLEETYEKLEDDMKNISIGMILGSVLINLLIGGLIVSAIVAAIVKKREPEITA